MSHADAAFYAILGLVVMVTIAAAMRTNKRTSREIDTERRRVNTMEASLGITYLGHKATPAVLAWLQRKEIRVSTTGRIVCDFCGSKCGQCNQDSLLGVMITDVWDFETDSPKRTHGGNK